MGGFILSKLKIFHSILFLLAWGEVGCGFLFLYSLRYLSPLASFNIFSLILWSLKMISLSIVNYLFFAFILLVFSELSGFVVGVNINLEEILCHCFKYFFLPLFLLSGMPDIMYMLHFLKLFYSLWIFYLPPQSLFSVFFIFVCSIDMSSQFSSVHFSRSVMYDSL